MSTLLTLDEAASLLKVSKRTAYSYVQTGTLPATKVGGQWRVRPEHLARLTGACDRVEEDAPAEYVLAAPSSMGASPKTRLATLGFEAKLWQAADLMRNNIDPAEFKHLTLGLLFLRSLSLPPGSSSAIATPTEAQWRTLAARTNSQKFGSVIDAALAAIESSNPTLAGALPIVFDASHLSNQRLVQLFNLVGDIDLGDARDSARDVLGRVYEYFLSRFASAEAKNGGEFYTPTSIVQLLVELLEPNCGTLYDPCCGSGGMFVQSRRFIENHGGKGENLTFYGQESNKTTWRIARMNLAVRGMCADLGPNPADTLLDDIHPTLRADYVMANPPFNVSAWGSDLVKRDPRWVFGLPPESNANYAWLQHIYARLSNEGRAAVVLANGSVSSLTGGEGEIRRRMIESDIVESIIALPGQMFYATQVPVCVWLLAAPGARRNRLGEVLFIDARKLGRMESRVHKVFSEADITSVAQTYSNWRHKKNYDNQLGFCRSVSLEEVSKQNFVLSPGRYVGTEQEATDIAAGNLADTVATVESLLRAADDCNRRLRATLAALQGA